MRNLLLLLLISAFVLSGCDEDDDNTPNYNIVKSISFVSIDTNVLPQNIRDYIRLNYPGVSIQYAYKEDFSDGSYYYEVKLDDETELYFDKVGNFMGYDDNSKYVLIGDLPQSITSYISSNHPQESIVKTEIEYENGNMLYEVKLSNGLELFFDDQGNFVKQEDDSFYIPTIDLPLAIPNYVSANYPGFLIIKAEKDYENNILIYKIMLDNLLELYFDKDGNFIKHENEHLDIENLPQSIKDYISNNYSGETIVKAEKENEHGSLFYKVKLSNDLKLIFDNNGNFVRIDD